MIALAGRLLVLAALLSSAAGALLGFASGSLPGGAGRRWTRRLALFFAAAMVLANLLMEYALLRHDFSVGYVAQVGSRAVPVWVTVVSLWSSLEGSILFWGLVMAVYVLVATFGPGRAPTPYAVAVWLACGAFFSFLIAGPAQPFATVAVKALDGPGPNPLLQNHVLMAIHPPFLYAGYVGMTIPFGLACAALLEGKAAREFIGPLRNFLLLPWIFLTVAIVLGGWWAYEVLGWGGYWAWDPVENASLLPWLTATAALHSALLVERKGVLKGWTLTLVMATWLLTILGTFMTRSGVFNSVHSFTQSAIGPTLLVFLAAALLFSVLLLTLRIDLLAAEGQLERGASRDVALLVQNLLFVLFTFTVLLGTVFPLVVEAVRGAQISVGRPYFDRMTVPIGVALIFVMGLGPALPWGRATREEARAALLFPLAGGVALLLVAFALGLRNAWALVTLFFGGYTAQVTLAQMLRPVRQRMLAHGEGLLQALASSGGRGRRRTGAYLAHAGVLLVMLAIAVSSTMGQSMEVQLHAGESASLGSYTITFAGGERVDEPHRRSQVAQIDVTRNGRSAGSLYPRMNLYETQREPIGTPAVRSSLTEDLYISIHNIDPATRTVGLLVLVNPMVPWIWIATAVTAIGGILSLWPSWRARPVTAPAAALEGSSG